MNKIKTLTKSNLFSFFLFELCQLDVQVLYHYLSIKTIAKDYLFMKRFASPTKLYGADMRLKFRLLHQAPIGSKGLSL